MNPGIRATLRYVITLGAVVLLLALPTSAFAAPLGQWTPTTNYPLQVAGESCFVYSNNVYCLGGFDSKGNDYDNAYFAPLSPSGIGTWASTTPFPVKIDSSSCALWSATVYCVGGENATSVAANVYQASVTSGGIGSWSQAAAYPQTIAATSCFAYSGFLYCVGGFDITGDETASAYYASLSSGLKSWTSTTPYPFAINSEACLVQGDYVYCVAGNEESGLPQFPVTNVYYAQLSSSGIGQWTATTQYPDALSTVSCVLDSGGIYCAGGFNVLQRSSDHVYSATVTGAGLSSWTNSTAYPIPFDVSSCVTDLGYMYCVAGRNFEGKLITMMDTDYYASLGSAGNVTSSTSVSSSNSTSSTSTTSTSTTPEFNSSALFVTTLSAVCAVALIFRTRFDRASQRRA